MTEEDKPFIEFTKVEKAFGPKKIFDDLTLSIHRDECLTIVGESGAGKSVLLKLLIGLLDTSGGEIMVDGKDVTKMSEEGLYEIRRRISMLFQGAALFDSLSVGENVAYPLHVQLRLSKADTAARVAEKLELVGLPGIEDQMPAELSGGMKKRVALARAIAVEPEVILFDEPTTGLDPPNTRRISDLIRSIQEKLHITAIVVTHDLPSAYLMSDRIAMLSERRILAVLAAEEFRTSKVREIRDFVSAMNAEAGES